VKEIYFMAPDDDDPAARYFYYATSSNLTGSRHPRPPTATGKDFSTGSTSHIRQLTVTESVPARLRCLSVGGYPAPRLRMLLGDRDVTEHFRSRSASALRGVAGMRVIDIRSELYTSGWTLSAEDDEQTARCTAFVDRRLGEQFAVITLHVQRTSLARTRLKT